MVEIGAKDMGTVNKDKRVHLSQYVAEWQMMTRNLLVEFEGNEDIDELVQALWVCEAAARRWHMREAIESGHIEMPVIEDFDELSTNNFKD